MEYFWPAPRAEIVNGQPVMVPKEKWRPLRAEDQFDAVLYLGPAPTDNEIPLSSAVCNDPGYLAARLRRLSVAGLPPPVADELKKHCAPAAPAR